MKRALFVSTSTLVGLYGALSYAPSAADPGQNLALGLGELSAGDLTKSPTPSTSTSVSPTASPSVSPTQSASASPSPSATRSTAATTKPKKTKSPTPSSSASNQTPTGPVSGDFTGSRVRAAKYGIVQVQIRVVDGVMTDLGVLSYPDADTESAGISGTSIPQLKAEALSLQSANLSNITGASDTSGAFMTSLRAAMALAGL